MKKNDIYRIVNFQIMNYKSTSICQHLNILYRFLTKLFFHDREMNQRFFYINCKITKEFDKKIYDSNREV